MTDLDTLRYPVGPFQRITAPLDGATRARHIETIERAPARIRSLVTGLSAAQLDTPYRPGGWTIRQVVHHVPDSHMNAYIRMKLAATEDGPTIRTYEEARWAELPDAKAGPIALSLDLLEALHRRWVVFLRALSESDCRRAYVHAELGRMTIDEAIGLYEWHSRHHTAHIEHGIRD